MIKQIYSSEIDRANLSKLKTIESKEVDKSNYSGVIVQKPWGYEYLMFENDYVAIWILHLKRGHGTSIHCHPRKKSSLVVLSGKVVTSTLTEWFEFKPVQGVVYDAGVFHTTKALANDTFIMELESPPDKKDLVRLKDSYGREDKGYEGKNQYSRDLKKFNYVFFNKKDINWGIKKRFNDIFISIKKCQSNYLNEEIYKENLNNKSVYSIIEEKIVDPEHKLLLWPGGIFDIDHIKDQKNIRLYNNCLLLVLETI